MKPPPPPLWTAILADGARTKDNWFSKGLIGGTNTRQPARWLERRLGLSGVPLRAEYLAVEVEVEVLCGQCSAVEVEVEVLHTRGQPHPAAHGPRIHNAGRHTRNCSHSPSGGRGPLHAGHHSLLRLGDSVARP
jgi:hypothetical protein